MIIRQARPSDSEQIYSHFSRANITREDIAGGGGGITGTGRETRVPKRGFFEYDLGFSDVAARVDSQFSLVMKNPRREIVGYMLAYSVADLPRFEGEHHDPVHDVLKQFDREVVYVDQLFLESSYPITFAARFSDAWEHMIRGEGVPGVAAAIPEKPWKNTSSRRIALAKGFSRQGRVQSGNVSLGLFAKPYLPLDNPFEGIGDKLIINS